MTSTRTRSLLRLALLVAVALLIAGLAIVWACRVALGRDVYVSELGATGMPTAGPYSVALLLFAGSGLVVAAFSTGIRARHPLLARAGLSSTLAVSAVSFAVASQVTCTSGCPVPFVDPAAAPQDLTHTIAATIGFGGAAIAMMQVASARPASGIGVLSRLAAWIVGSIVALGALLAVLGTAVYLGAWFEFIGMSVAVVWLAGFAAWLAVTLEHPGRSAACPWEVARLAASALAARSAPTDGTDAAERVVTDPDRSAGLGVDSRGGGGAVGSSRWAAGAAGGAPQDVRRREATSARS